MNGTLYTQRSCDPKYNAQQNLTGRTHYVDDATLRFHASRILFSDCDKTGLLFYLVESYALDWEKTRRAFRPVIFDLFGNVIERPALGDGYPTQDKAREALFAALKTIKPKQVTREGLKREREYFRQRDAQVTRLLREAA